MHRQLIRLLNFSLVFLLLTAIWAGWYVSHRGFGQKWRKKVAEEFASRGVYLTVRRLTLDPLRGLVAQDVKIFREQSQRNQVARINQLKLDINYTRLLQKVSFINAIEMQDGEMELPDNARGPNGIPLRLEKLQATLFFPPDRLEVGRLAGEISGVHFELAGTLLNPDVFRLTRQEASIFKKDADQKNRLIEDLAQIDFKGSKCNLEVHFSGDLAKIETLRIDKARFFASEMAWKALNVRKVEAEGSFADGLAVLQRLRWEDEAGESVLAGSRRSDGGASLQFQLGTDWPELARTLFPADLWKTLILKGRRNLRGELTYTPANSPALLLIGAMNFGEFSYKGLSFDGLQASYSSNGAQWMIRHLKVRHQTGDVQGNFLGQAANFRAQLTSNVNPMPLLPALLTNMPAELRGLHFTSPPHAELEINGTGADPLKWTTTGHLTLGRTSFRGYALNSARGDLRLTGLFLQLENLQVEREEGSGEGAFSWNGSTQEVRLRNVSSTLDPVAVCTWISPKLGEIVSPYRFRGSPEVQAEGVVHVKSLVGTNLSLHINGPKGMNYLFLKKDLPFDQVKGDLTIRDRQLEIRNLQAAIFNGRVSGEIDVSINPENRSYRTAFHVSDMAFPKLTGLYFDYQGSSGSLAGDAEFHGVGLDPRLLTGSGKLTVQDGDVFEIPVFGPFSKTLDSVVPGFGYSQARRASGSFTMADGLIKTKDFKISGKGVSMYGDGSIAFLDNSMDFNMRINANGLTGAFLDPVSKLFEFHSNGPLTKPTWKPRQFSLPASSSSEKPLGRRNSPVATP